MPIGLYASWLSVQEIGLSALVSEATRTKTKAVPMTSTPTVVFPGVAQEIVADLVDVFGESPTMLGDRDCVWTLIAIPAGDTA